MELSIEESLLQRGQLIVIVFFSLSIMRRDATTFFSLQRGVRAHVYT